MASIEVTGFHCTDETGKRDVGSNEIAFCLAAFSINSYQQYDEFRRFYTRVNTGVDSGEDHSFNEPIKITVNEDDGAHPLRYLEIHVAAYEIDGRGDTGSLARSLYERWRTAVDEELYPYRNGRIDTDRSAWDGLSKAVVAKGSHQLVIADAWRMNIREPFEITTSAPGVGQSNGLYVGPAVGGVHRSIRGVQRFDSDPTRRTDRRFYGATDPLSSFRFDTHYYI